MLAVVLTPLAVPFEAADAGAAADAAAGTAAAAAAAAAAGAAAAAAAAVVAAVAAVGAAAAGKRPGREFLMTMVSPLASLRDDKVAAAASEGICRPQVPQ